MTPQQEALPMPDGRTDRLQPEMYLGYSGGMNAFTRNHREMEPDTLKHLVNGTVRGGWVQTRPSFEWLPPTYPSNGDKTIFETGKIQGSGFYSTDKAAVMVYAIDGNLFSFDPISKQVANLNPGGVAPFSKYADFVYFQTRAGHLIAGDGLNRQVVITGFTSRISNPVTELPISLMMADSWGRLAVVDPDRKRIRFSNHELDPDPSFSPLGFQEATEYYLNAKWFKVPDHIGKITWIGFIPKIDTRTGTGPLVVLGEKGTHYYDVSIDRQQWMTQNISGTLFPDIGGLSHRAQVVRNDNLFFSDQDGRIRNLKQASEAQQSITVKRFDRGVFPYYENEPRDLRKWRVSCNWNERVLTAIQPESKWIHTGGSPRFNVRHRGIVVWNGEVTESSDERDYSTWDGLWTGIYPATLDVGTFDRQKICIALSVDEDGINRPYAIREDGAGRYDLAPNDDGELACKPIELQIATRTLDFSSRDSDYSLLLKRINRGVIRIGERYGRTDFTGYVSSDQDYHVRQWFQHKTDADHDLKFETDQCGVCRLTDGLPHHDPKLQLESDQATGIDPVRCTQLKHFYKCGLHLIVSGWARIEEIMLDAVKIIENHTRNTECAEPVAKRNTGCKISLWRYHARTAKEVTE